MIDPSALPDEATLLGAVLFLMTKHAERQCPGLRRAIAAHLDWLARHPSPLLSAKQRRLYGALAIQWGEVGATAKPHVDMLAALAPTPASYLQ